MNPACEPHLVGFFFSIFFGSYRNSCTYDPSMANCIPIQVCPLACSATESIPEIWPNSMHLSVTTWKLELSQNSSHLWYIHSCMLIALRHWIALHSSGNITGSIPAYQYRTIEIPELHSSQRESYIIYKVSVPGCAPFCSGQLPHQTNSQWEVAIRCQ